MGGESLTKKMNEDEGRFLQPLECEGLLREVATIILFR
jgi:hypothetical protein